MLVNQASVVSLKYITQRKRPNYRFGDKKDSFPSGHTAASFSAASFIHFRYSFKEAIVPYMLAGFVGYSRVKAKKHHVSDVVAGAILSTGINYFLIDKKISVDVKKDGIFLRFFKKF